MTFCTAHMYGYSPQCEWAYETWVLRFPAWLDHFLHSVHLCGFSPLWVSMWRIMWLRNSCTRCICLDSLQCVFWCNISWATVPVEKLHWLNFWAMGIEKNIFGSKMGWYIGNNRGCPGNCLMRSMTLLQILHSLYWTTGALGPGIWKNGAKMAIYG